MSKSILFAAGLCLLAGTPAFANSSCLEVGQIYNFNAPDNKTLIVEDNFHNKFKLGLMGYCPSLNFKERIGFKSIGGMQLSCLSPGDQVIVRNMGTGGQVCPIRTIVPYTADMAKADKAAAAAAAAASR
ncbi:MAG TPA: DUF6491 family protein [Rhizomicrobium sp.]|jgi:hypothetical protein